MGVVKKTVSFSQTGEFIVMAGRNVPSITMTLKGLGALTQPSIVMVTE